MLDVERIDDPLPRSSFGTIGRFVSVRWREERSAIAYATLEVPYSDDDLGWVDPATLRLFEIDVDTQRWTQLPDSGVDTEGGVVYGSVAHDGVYGVVGLPADPDAIKALEVFASLGPQLAEEREQGRKDLQSIVCERYLSGEALEFGLGLGIGPLGLPELNLLLHIPVPSKWVPKDFPRPGFGKHYRPGPLIYALLTLNFDDEPFQPAAAAIEIVDTSTWTKAGGFPIPNVNLPLSLSVSPDGQRLYVVDNRKWELRAFFADGTSRGTLQLPAPPFDCVLDATGSTLYIATTTGLVVVDTATVTVSRTVPTSGTLLMSVATTPGSPTVVAVGAPPALHIFDANLTPTVVPITDPGGPNVCGVFPTDVVVSSSWRAVLWDGNCDRFYEVRLLTKTQDHAATFRLPRDNGQFIVLNDRVRYSVVTGKAYAVKESGEIAIKDVGQASGTTAGAGTFTGTPFVPVMPGFGRPLWVTVMHRGTPGGGADTIDEYDTVAGTFTRGRYTFSDASMFVRSAVAI